MQMMRTLILLQTLLTGANEDESAEKSAWQQISDESVKKYLSKVKESKSQGSDSIHPKLIKETVVSISKPATKMFKTSMEEKKHMNVLS
jgi:predicted DNA binding CopG/RHH family protein